MSSGKKAGGILRIIMGVVENAIFHHSHYSNFLPIAL
jgi:hypothetical protein